MTKSALVLGGGGVAGIAWETGILIGIADKSPAAAAALLDSDVLLGTSVGSAGVAQIGRASCRDRVVTGVQTCALPILGDRHSDRNRGQVSGRGGGLAGFRRAARHFGRLGGRR